MRFSSSSDTPPRAILVCMAQSSLVMPCSRCSRVSPTQRMTVSPASRAARVRSWTVTSVSPKYWRRSLWPMMTIFTPMAASISALTSPVKAPDLAQWQFSAPIWMLVPSAASWAALRSTKGVQATTSTVASFTRGAMALMSSLASAGVHLPVAGDNGFSKLLVHCNLTSRFFSIFMASGKVVGRCPTPCHL